jgi:hypothetical protein
MRSRARSLLFVLGPAVLVAALAWWFSSWPLRQNLQAKERELATVRAALPTAAALQAVEQRRAELRERLRQRQEALANPVVATPATILVAANERATWHLQLEDVLARHQLAVHREQRTEIAVPAALAQGLLGLVAGTRVTAWTLHWSGSYPDVLAALTELQQANIPFVVLELGMRRDQQGALAWNMVVM